MHCSTQWPQPCSRLIDASAGDSWILTGILGQSLGSVLHFLLGPGAHKVLFVPSQGLFLQSCVGSGGSMVGLMVTSSKRAYATSRSIAPRSPAPDASHCCPQETLKGRPDSVSLAQSGYMFIICQ